VSRGGEAGATLPSEAAVATVAAAGPFVVGVDGCRGGWAVVVRPLDGAPPRLGRIDAFADVMALADAAGRPAAVVAVDMPVGLPDHVGPAGRGPERAVRPLLAARQSSVFAVPSRRAVMESGDDYRLACALALATSEPPRKVARQSFHLFPKIREIDASMTPAQEARVYEVHPELAFWRLNGGRPMSLPKKIRSEASRPGIDERVALLGRFGYDAAFFAARRPAGVGPDDAVDAAVLAVIAERILAGLVRPFPDPPPRDGRGLRMAIWA